MLDCGTPDIIIPPGDTAPNTRAILMDASDPDGPDAEPLNLQNADLSFKTVALYYQNRDSGSPVLTRPCVVIQTTPTTNRGVVEINWAASGGALAPPGSNHRARFVVTDIALRQQTLPRGPDIELEDGSNPSFLWIQVSRAFPA